MKKIGKMVLMMMLAMPMLGINVTAATTENPDGKFAQIHNLGFYVYANNASANTVKLKFKDKWGKDVYVWVNAGPLYEHNPNNKNGSCN